jgi:lipoprotein-anchoring transpeptidase ErfK/SrfK
MLRATIAGLMLASAGILMGGVLASGTASAQWGGLFGDDPAPRRHSYKRPPSDGFLGDEQRGHGSRYRSVNKAGRPSRGVWSGGSRPYIAPVSPDRISFPSGYPVGSVVIDHRGRQLLFIESPSSALRYPISVGREGFGWTGTQRISKIVSWPGWTPPASMRARDPHLPAHMTGGLKNPLGAKALYLGNSLYRIHGTNDPRSIGRASSSGCFRMLNGHVVDLARRVDIGSTVIVVRRLPSELARRVAEQVVMDSYSPPPMARPVRRHDRVPEDLFGPPSDEGRAGEGAGAAEDLF